MLRRPPLGFSRPAAGRRARASTWIIPSTGRTTPTPLLDPETARSLWGPPKGHARAFSCAPFAMGDQMKNWHATSLVGAFVFAAAAPASAELGGQVFFRGGVSMLVGGNRGGEVFTDVNGATGLRNDDTTGIGMGFGLDLPLLKDPWFGNLLLAEIVVDYARFSRKLVVQATSALLGGSNTSNDTTYQTPGIHFAAGIEYRLADPVSIGVDARYNLGLGYTHVGQDNSFTTGGYLGFNF